VSDVAGDALFGSAWRADARSERLPCGVPLDAFAAPVDRAMVRGEFGLPAVAFVVGHVGVFRPQKNHAFLLAVFAEILRQEPAARLLLIGSGPTEAETRALADRLGISDHVIFAGGRPDVPHLLQGGPDVFLFPSLFEGLPVALVEAQAAGLPCVISDSISPEADLVSGLITRQALTAPVASWAAAVLDARNRLVSQEVALDAVRRSPMNLETGLATLIRLYETAREPAPTTTILTASDPILVGNGRHD